ncbi:MAG TPA: type III-B CRISPR module-associated protein Cmr5 [Candidatus Dormibacteraeota bacterium]|nr:type III-B CRISPR module-associated protein Cmr5 [Candidatus Dormibacteraeota bacterium]
MARPDPPTPPPAPSQPRLRQQMWALHAYESVRSVTGNRTDYEIAVNDLGADVLRSGLAAAMAALERKRDRGGGLLLKHLADAKISGLADATAQDLPDRVRRLDLDAYLLATREVLQLATWFRRAVQATSDKEG